MSGLERAIVEQHSVVGQDADLVTPNIRITADQRRAIRGLIFVKAAAIDDSRDHLAHVELHPVVARDHSVELSRVIVWRLGLLAFGGLLWTLEAGHDVA